MPAIANSILFSSAGEITSLEKLLEDANVLNVCALPSEDLNCESDFDENRRSSQPCAVHFWRQ
jgi:hypothetical protein